MSAIFGRQPVIWLGLIGTLILGVVAALSATPVIVDGQPLQTAANVIKIAGPLILAFIQQYFVTPVAAPQLPVGTEVTVTKPDTNVTTAVTL